VAAVSGVPTFGVPVIVGVGTVVKATGEGAAATVAVAALDLARDV
jgi:hypothetical protein